MLLVMKRIVLIAAAILVGATVSQASGKYCSELWGECEVWIEHDAQTDLYTYSYKGEETKLRRVSSGTAVPYASLLRESNNEFFANYRKIGDNIIIDMVLFCPEPACP